MDLSVNPFENPSAIKYKPSIAHPYPGIKEAPAAIPSKTSTKKTSEMANAV